MLGGGFGGLGGDGGEPADGAGLVGGEEGGGAGLVDLVDGGRGGAEGRGADNRAEIGRVDGVAACDLGGVEVGVEEVADQACLVLCLVFDRHAGKVVIGRAGGKGLGRMTTKSRTNAVIPDHAWSFAERAGSNSAV